MAKKFGKFLFVTAAISTAAAGAYYYLKKKNEPLTPEEDEFDDFDDFSSDLEEDSAEASDSHASEDKKASDNRSYVDLSLEKAKDALENVTKDAVEKTEEFFDDEDNSNDAM